MNRRYTDALAFVLYLLCAAALSGLACIVLDVLSFRHWVKLILATVAVITGYSAAVFQCIGFKNPAKKQSTIRITLYVMLVFYIILLLDFTLFDGGYGRNIFNVYKWGSTDFAKYIADKTNLVPFATVRLFINGYMHNNVSFQAMLENIFGNLAAFMPFAFFVPALFKKVNRWYKLLAAVVPSVMLIELLQLMFLTGSSDIDDVILNSIGALVLYAIIKSKRISYILNIATFGVWINNEEK